MNIIIRLTRETVDALLVIKLEGDLRREAVELIRQECLPRPGEPQRLRLDLRRLGQMDAAGLRLLKEIKTRPGVELMNCSPLLLTLLEVPPE
jgi:anti-anti-sigma regulatory factor